jgi:disulfide oxidoreductase YuzD
VYEGQVDVTYYDAALPEIREQFADVVQTAESRYWPFPLVMVDDRVVMAGHVDVYGLTSLLEQKLRNN